jgi:hypothetical protein
MLDTGLLDSEKDLGINGGQHFLFRSVRHCAPLVTEGHTIPYSEDTPDVLKTLGYSYGDSRHSDEPSMYQASVFPINGSADTIQQWVRIQGSNSEIYLAN